MKLSNYTLTPDSARKLATRVAKESNGVAIKIGETNGKPVLHLIHGELRTSRNLTNEADWETHDWNAQFHRPRQKKRKEIEGLSEAVANKEAQ